MGGVAVLNLQALVNYFTGEFKKEIKDLRKRREVFMVSGGSEKPDGKTDEKTVECFGLTPNVGENIQPGERCETCKTPVILCQCQSKIQGKVGTR